MDAGVQHAYAEQRRPGQTQQRHQHQHAAQVQLDQSQPGGQQQRAAVADNRHRAPQHPVPGVERAADAPQHQQAHRQHHDRADGAKVVAGQVKRKAEPLCQEHEQKICYAAGQCRAQHIGDKPPVYPLVVRLQRQEKRRCTDGCGRQQRQLQRQKRVSQRQHQRHNAEQYRENIFDQKQRCRPLDVVDDPATLGHHMGQRAEVRVQQHQLCHLAGSLRAGRHRNATISIF